MTFTDRDLSPPNNRDLLQTALAYRTWNWSVFPVGQNKKPLCATKPFRHQRPSDKRIERLFQGRTGARGVGVILGHISGGLAVADFDTTRGYDQWAERHPDLARSLPALVTARGRHVVCRCPIEVFRKFPPDGWRGEGDFRSDRKHFAVTAGSLHDSGHVYRWLTSKGHCANDFPCLDVISAGLLPHRTDTHPPSALSRPTSTRKTPKTENGSLREYGDILCKHRASLVRISDDVPGWGDLSPVVQESIRLSLPWKSGIRCACLFVLCGHLRSIEPGVRAPEWEDAVLCWWRLARPVIDTKDWQTTWNDFQTQWDARKHLATDGRANQLYALVRERPGTSSERLYSLCEHLSRLTVGGAFYLPSRKVGAEALGVSAAAANALIRRFVTAGVLMVVVRGRMGGGASYYRLLAK